MSYDQIRSSIRGEIDRRKNNATPNTGNRTKKPELGAQSAKSNNSSNVNCFYCGKRGHYAKDCRRKRADLRNRNLGRPKYQDFCRDGRPNVNRWSHYRLQGSERRFEPRQMRDDPSPATQDNIRRHPRERQEDSENGGPANPSWDNRGFMTRLVSLSASTDDDKTKKTWLDSGANISCIWDKKLLSDYKEVEGQSVQICEGKSSIRGEGNAFININGNCIKISAKHVPSFNENVISVNSISKHFRVIFEDTETFSGFILQDYVTGEEQIRRKGTDGMYPFPCPTSKRWNSLNADSRTTDAAFWHNCLGHPGKERFLAASISGLGIPELSSNEVVSLQYPSCMEASSKRAPVSYVERRSIFPLSLTHTDITGRLEPPSLSGKKYVAVFIDDHTRYSIVYFLNSKSEFEQSLISYRSLVENEQSRRMYRIRMDRAGENSSSSVSSFAMKNVLVI